MAWKKIKSRLTGYAIVAAGVLCIALTGCQSKDDNADSETTAKVEESGFGEAKEDAASEETKSYEYRESGMEYDKEESVYVLADANGNPTEITVTAALKNPGQGEDILDTTWLTDIINKEGDEEYQNTEGQDYIWQNHGEDIHYEGTAPVDSSLPVGVDVTYYLDGQKVNPEALAGATGQVKIHFTYTNNTGTNGSVVPFMAISGLTLSGNQVSNVTVENGTSKYVDGDYLVYGVFFPGLEDALQLNSMDLLEDEELDLPKEMEISFDARDFELEFTATLFSNGFLEEEKYDKISDKLDKLADKLGDTTDKTKNLKDKIRTLKSSGIKLKDGANSLSQGLSQLDDAMAQMAAANPALAELSQSVSALADGSKSLAEGVTQYTDGVAKACDGLTDTEKSDSGESNDTQDQEQQIRSLADRIKSLKTMDIDYTNFGGIREGQTGSVSFIIETSAIGDV